MISTRPKLFYRFGLSEMELLPSCTECYDGIVVSAHMLAYTDASVYSSLVRATENKEIIFFIDPMTYVFARRLDNLTKNGKMKRSFKKLMPEYGSIIARCEDHGELQSDQFLENDRPQEQAMLEIVQRVLAFQRGKLTDVLSKSSLPKYARILKKTQAPPTSLVPSFLVAPYFYWASRSDPWYRINLALSKMADSDKEDMKLYPVLCFSKELLADKHELREIVRDYAGFDGYLIWVSDLDEEASMHDYLTGLKTLIQELAKYQKPIYSLYGGYLMLLLSKFGLSGFVAGICYGDSKSVDAPSTLGGGFQRYYLPVMHLKTLEEPLRATLSVSARNAHLLCDCEICGSILNELEKKLPMRARAYIDSFFTSLGSRKSGFREHFVRARHKEALMLEYESLPQTASRLDQEAQQIEKSDPPPPPRSDPLKSRHLREWAKLLS